ncbi:hypothetical protein EYB45_07575 [Erythrobacteraceae bacterium CFH 75059]|uniref:hypothetical protein n=1 Tax=Qipengyuania thermophila TaxID=2509361 RepID=UPI0010224533|nr:hypothetical protein [Qipengyuania thermophila]TCD05329.1 hypothetical protein EYB45_07575 [Erythrobacteraceae bacterium CFH 75059]
MRSLSAIAALAVLSACATVPRSGLTEVVQGETTICLDRSSFVLPSQGMIVDADQGRLGVNLTGMIGPHAFEVTESASFAPLGETGRVAFTGPDFHVMEVGSGAGSWAVIEGTMPSAAPRPVIRIEHVFGTESVELARFFQGFRLNRGAQESCGRQFGRR